MAFLINSPGLSTTGTDSADFFSVLSGGLTATTLLAAAGNDSIQMQEPTASADKVSIQLQGGEDILTASGITLSGQVLAGAGADKIIGSTTKFQGKLGLGAGNDTVLISAGLVDTLAGGGGSDLITISAAVSATASLFTLGAGADTLTFTAGKANLLSASTVYGGGGADSITVDANTSTHIDIYGDRDNYVGNDTIKVMFTAASAVIKGNMGDDIISVDDGGAVDASSLFLGNQGNDSIDIIGELEADSNITIDGGQGSDTITLTATTTSTKILGGGGADKIQLDAQTGSVIATVFGQAGADSIIISADVNSTTGIADAIGFSAFTDSTVDAMDTVTFTNSLSGTTEATGGTLLTIHQDVVSANTAVFVNDTVTVSAGVAQFSSISSVADRVSALDAGLTTEGRYALFTDDAASAAYLFVQGGDSDLVVKFENSGTDLNLGSAGTGLATNGNASSFTVTIGKVA
ncbi:hypothetical protein Q3Y53_01315 [Synechococcus sp. YX-04-1]|uniref:hypothetical protein n=1 Tax=Synechococcus sp. YX-04-1 TaxID=3062778 RepID=UPI0026E2A839|nr:hypothetical protein [Synechococcus sp. YX-04-1]MDO6351169.1 hypothetical protein [Synechococcus sp. YX-04-1]